MDSEDTDDESDTDAAETREIHFTSTAIEMTDETAGRVRGDLLFQGETLPVVLDFNFDGGFAEGPVLERPPLGFSATTTIDRTLFGLRLTPS